MAGIDFYKMSGAGNDFVALVEPSPDTDLPGLTRAVCRRGLSVGADGLFTLRRRPDGVVRMLHFNADGGAADLCLNGTRCAAALAFHLHWADDTVRIETGAGTALGVRSASGIRIAVPPPGEPRDRTAELGLEPGLRGHVCHVGVPHLVVTGASACDDDVVVGAGPVLRRHPALGPEGANVDFLVPDTDGPHRLRTWERGVEGETLACGSGAVACAVVLARLHGSSRHRFLTGGGFELVVTREVTEDGATWFLEGDARIVLHGRLEEGALAGPGLTGGSGGGTAGQVGGPW